MGWWDDGIDFQLCLYFIFCPSRYLSRHLGRLAARLVVRQGIKLLGAVGRRHQVEDGIVAPLSNGHLAFQVLQSQNLIPLLLVHIGLTITRAAVAKNHAGITRAWRRGQRWNWIGGWWWWR